MNELEKRRLDREFEMFVSKNFEKPRSCKNLDQIRYYIRELSETVEDLKNRCNYVPERAYIMLNQYNHLQNTLLYKEFKNTCL